MFSALLFLASAYSLLKQLRNLILREGHHGGSPPILVICITTMTKCLMKSSLGGEWSPLAFGVRAQSITAEEVRWQEHEVTGPSASAVRSWCPPYGFHSIWTPVHGMMLSTLMLFLLHGISLEIPSQTHPDVCLLCDSKSTQGDKEGGHYKSLAQVPPASSWLTSVQCCVHSSWSL